MSRKTGVIITILLTLTIIGVIYHLNTNGPQTKQQTPQTATEPGQVQEELEDIAVIAENLEIPWEIAFLPNGELLVTERPGTLLRIGNDRTVIEVSGVRHIGEGGLMGLALHPNFEENSLIYLYLTSEEAGRIVNRVERYKLDGDSLLEREVIIDGILGSSIHDGGRIEFGPDGYLYITTGDAGDKNLAQNTDSLNGKILRINEDGSIPEDNPFGNAVYSYGHRNPQGLAWDSEGRLWATEHGRSGILSGFDELNLIDMGKNYGWPTIQGDESEEGMETPVVHSGPDTTWAPAGADFINGSIFFAGLRGSRLYKAELDGTNVANLSEHLSGEYGRLRAVRLGPDGFLYITTSNQDGRGTVREADDKLIRINPEILE